MRKAVIYLRDQAVAEGSHGPHQAALTRLLARFLPDEVARYDSDPISWEPGDMEPLRNRYSEVLSVRVEGLPSNYLLLKAADIPHTYGDPNLPIGPDHELIAILILEGVLKDIASGNWDGLVEKATEKLSGRTRKLSVHVDANDLREANGPAWLVKFHGCAARALADPDRYASALVATRAQIAEWSTTRAFAHMRDALTSRTQRLRSLFLGLSVQDQNLLETLRVAADGQPWPWDEGNPAYVFAEEELALTQEDVLDICYGDEFNNNRELVIRRSLFTEYGGPLLAALVVYVVVQKLKIALSRRSGLPDALLTDLMAGIDFLESKSSRAIGHRYQDLAKFLINGQSRFVRQFHGSHHYQAGVEYTPLASGTGQEVATDPSVTINGTDWLALCLALLGSGGRAGWRLRIQNREELTFLQVTRPSETPVLVAVAKGFEAADQFIASDVWSTSPEVMVLLYVADEPNASARSSSSRLGSARIAGSRREIWMPEVIANAADGNEARELLIAAGGA